MAMHLARTIFEVEAASRQDAAGVRAVRLGNCAVGERDQNRRNTCKDV